MKNYVKPVVLANEELAEGVYAASGCYSVSGHIHQSPQDGRGDYRIQFNGKHAAEDGHHSGEQTLTIYFNQPVIYKGSNGTLAGGDGTTALVITYNYHNNGDDNIGLGDVIVESDPGLALCGQTLGCNYHCNDAGH